MYKIAKFNNEFIDTAQDLKAYNLVNCIEVFDLHTLRHNFKPGNYRPNIFPRQMSHNSENNKRSFLLQKCARM